MIKPRDINETIRYTMWSVFRRTNMEPPPTQAAKEVVDAIEARGRGRR